MQEKNKTNIKAKEPWCSFCMIVVELRGIEPLSESNLTGLSPGADDYLHSLAGA